MPTASRERILPELNHGQLVCLRRRLFARAIHLMQPILLAEVEPTFDNLVTLSNLVVISISEDENHAFFTQWLTMLKCFVSKNRLCKEMDSLDEEAKEERRRYVNQVFELPGETRIKTADFAYHGWSKALVVNVDSRPSFGTFLQYTNATHERRLSASTATMP